jgi:hypothetical protein
VITCAPRSAGWIFAKPPFFFPTGVRTASTMYASATLPSCQLAQSNYESLRLPRRFSAISRRWISFVPSTI